MKKFVIFMLSILISISLLGCTNATTQSSAQDVDQSTTESNNDDSQSFDAVAAEEVTLTGEDDYYRTYDVKVRNNTQNSIYTFTITVDFLDQSGDIIKETYPQVPGPINAGQAINFEVLIETTKDPAAIQVSGYTYYTGPEDTSNYISGAISSPEVFSVE